MAADLDAMLDRADAAIVIGDPALMALEERANRFERTGEELVYHDLAEEWTALTGLPFVSAVWGVAGNIQLDGVAEDFIRSRDHGLKNIDALVAEWTRQIAAFRGDDSLLPHNQHPLCAGRRVHGRYVGLLSHGGGSRRSAAIRFFDERCSPVELRANSDSRDDSSFGIGIAESTRSRATS